MKKVLPVLLSFCFILPSATFANLVPSFIHLQGRLTDKNNNPILEPTLVEIRIFQGGNQNNADEGVVVYKERVTINPGPDGSYQHEVGNGVPVEGHVLEATDFQTDVPVFMQINVDGLALLPRIKFSAQPFSFVADVALSVQNQSIEQNDIDSASFSQPGIGIVPQGGILMFMDRISCPAGFSEAAGLRNRVPMGMDLDDLDPRIPNGPNVQFGGEPHYHDIPHSHHISISSFTHDRAIGTGDAWVHFAKPRMIGGVAAVGSGDNVHIEGWILDYIEGPVEPTHSQSVDPLPASFSVLFCRKD